MRKSIPIGGPRSTMHRIEMSLLDLARLFAGFDPAGYSSFSGTKRTRNHDEFRVMTEEEWVECANWSGNVRVSTGCSGDERRWRQPSQIWEDEICQPCAPLSALSWPDCGAMLTSPDLQTVKQSYLLFISQNTIMIYVLYHIHQSRRHTLKCVVATQIWILNSMRALHITFKKNSLHIQIKGRLHFRRPELQ